MKISIITTVTNPEERNDPYLESIESYKEFADEVIVVNGGKQINLKGVKIINLPWPNDWNWKELPIHLNAGLKEANGDWVIKMDIDQMFHENDMDEIKRRLSQISAPCATFQKMSVLPFKRFMQKGEVMIAINKNRFGDKVCFGEDTAHYTDLCHPIWKEKDEEVPKGRIVSWDEITRTGISVWNFDYTFKTKEFTKKDLLRFSLAHEKYFGTTSWGRTEEEAFDSFINMMKKRFERASYQIIDHTVLPKYIRKRHYMVNATEFGHSGWGLI